MTAALSVTIKKRLGGFDLDVAFEAAAGITVLFGPSGAGKSTILAAIAGEIRPDQGRITVADTVLFDRRGGIDLKPEARRIGWVFQNARLFPHIDVEANLRYGLKRAGAGAPRIGFKEVKDVLGLGPLLSRRPRDLSGGEAQRVALGRALLSQPRLLLMDEPLSALDAARKADILAFIERVRDAFAIPTLYVTHALAETVRLADRLVVIEAGRVLAQGPLAELMQRADLPLLAARADAAAVVEGTVAAHEPTRGLTFVRAGDLDWACPLLDKPFGARVRLVVLARDVILADRAPSGLSARNVLAGSITDLTLRPDGTVMATVEVGGRRILSAVTADAVQALGLARDRPVWTVVKSVAIEGMGRGGVFSVLDG